MKKTVKILATTLSALLLMQTFAFAEEIDMQKLNEKHLSDFENMDRVYKYDFVEKREEEVIDDTEHINDANAVSLALSLGLMEIADDFKFHEENLLTKEEYDFAVSKFFMMYEPEKSEGIAYVTHLEAVDTMLSATGFDVYKDRYEHLSDYVFNVAGMKAKILNGISYNPQKNITRGEFARLLYNTLNCDVVEMQSAGAVENYVTDDGNNLLKKVFNAVLVDGCVTAANGISLFSDSISESDIIEIDRAEYIANIPISNDLLGRQVEAVVTMDDRDRFFVVGISESRYEKTVVIPSRDIVSFNGTSLIYNSENGQKRVNVGSVSKLCYNGTQKPVSELGDVIYSANEVRFVTSKRNGDYDIAVVLKYDDYTVSGVSKVDGSIGFDHGRKLNGSSYLKLDEEEKNFYIEGEDGTKMNYLELLPGDIISVITSPSGFLNIRVSSKKVEGEITAILDEGKRYIIDEEEYLLSEGYNENKKTDSEIPDIELGTEGKFYLNYRGDIADFDIADTTNVYAYLRTAIGGKKGLSNDLSLRLFTQDGAWKTYPIANKITIDGMRMSKEDAIENINLNKDLIFDALVRYRVNDNAEITFLDTINESSSEKDDVFAISKDETWNPDGNIKHNWTVDTDHIALTSSIYSMSKDTTVFYVPSNKENEKLYTVSKPSYASDVVGNPIDLYNLDEFSSTLLALDRAGGTANLSNDLKYLVVDKVSIGVNSEGEDAAILKGYSGFLPPNWFEVKLYSSPEDIDKVSKLKRGDVLHYAESGSDLKAFEVVIKADDFATGALDETTKGDFYISHGTVEKVDVSRSLVKVSLKTEGKTATYSGHSLAIYNKETGELVNASFGDIHQGDKVFCFGGNQLMRMLIVR